ncbi:LysR family transcriptional regulator [Parasedimentitalea marina]|uniref:LysR family transcriptional regulator n=1 Tax=Parasedimentitalea marina TaxID=2483033 RepID=A0A3T0N4W2_9RHOB|nr:LysR family transcriptional regulator [Parasedimentitalea marina]AZV79021.1 LysR family transcriptional regulator [Parasedimentitalea marina]
MLLENLNMFLRIVEKGGLAAAGRELGMAPATVTERLVTLESHYGARLLTRTTRSISLTDEGRELIVGARRILAEAEETEARIKLGAEGLSGSIKIAAPHDLGCNHLAPMLDSFIDEHREISIDLSLDDGNIDLVAQGIDLAVRYGSLSDSTMKSRKIHDNRRLVCAAPDYLKRNGTPLHPEDLAHHNCIIMRFGAKTIQDWAFVIDSRQHVLRVNGNRISNNGDLVRRWCIAGQGIVLKSEWDLKADLSAGKLVSVLEDYAPEPNSLNMVYPSGAVQPKRVRALMDHIAKAYHQKF